MILNIDILIFDNQVFMLQSILNLYIRFSFALGILAISRLHFLLMNFKSYMQQSPLEVMTSFIYGL